jgi:hypothetical protein
MRLKGTHGRIIYMHKIYVGKFYGNRSIELCRHKLKQRDVRCEMDSSNSRQSAVAGFFVNTEMNLRVPLRA